MKQKTLLLTLIMLVLATALSAQTAEGRIPKFRIAVDGGLGYKTAGSPKADFIINQDKMKNFTDQLRWTPMVGVDIHYLLKSGYGFGFKYLFNYSSGNATDLIISAGDGLHNFVSDSYERMYLNFAGPSFMGYQFLGRDKKWLVNSSVSPGYVHLRDESGILYSHMLVTGKTFGLFYDLGIEYFLNPSLSIGLNTGVFSATFKGVTQTDGSNTIDINLEKENAVNTTNINLNAGIRFYINK